MGVPRCAVLAKPSGKAQNRAGKAKVYAPDPFEADKRREAKRKKKMAKLGKVFIPRRSWE